MEMGIFIIGSLVLTLTLCVYFYILIRGIRNKKVKSGYAFGMKYEKYTSSCGEDYYKVRATDFEEMLKFLEKHLDK